MMLEALNPDNYIFTRYALLMLVSGIAIVILGLFVLIRERFSAISVAYLLMCLNVGHYVTFQAVNNANQDMSLTLFWCRIVTLGVIWIPFTILLLTAVLFGLYRKYRLVIAASVVMTILFMLGLLFTDLFIRGIVHFSWGNYGLYGPLGYAFITYFFCISALILRLYWREYQHCTTEQQVKRYRGLLAAFIGGYFGSVDFLPTFGIPIYPFGYLFVGFFTVVSMYIILRYRLVDITPELAADLILETMQGAVIVTSMDNRIKVINREALEMIGDSRTEVLGEDLATVFPIPAEVSETVRSGSRIFSHELTWSGNKGRYDVSLSASLLTDRRDSAPLGIVYVATDITDRKRAEELLRESEERYRELVDQSPDAICVHQQGSYVFVNKAAVTLFGAGSAQQLIGMPIIETVHPELRELVRDRIKHISDHHQKNDFIEEKMLKLDGTVFFAEICGVPVVYQGNPAIQVVIHDVTSRKQTEGRLQQLAKEQQVILDTITIGVVYLKKRRLVWTNPAFRSIFGYSAQESNDLDARRLYADVKDYERVGREGYPLINAGRVYTTEALSVRKDGSTFWLNLTGRAVNTDNPKEGSIWMLQDITAAKMTEEVLKTNEQYLSCLVDQATDAIFIHDSAGQILDCNKIACASLGYTREEILNMRVMDIDADFSPEKDVVAWEQLVPGTVAQIRGKHRRKDGTTFPVEVRVGLLNTDKSKAMIAIARDMTLREEAETALREKTLLLEDLTRNLEHRVDEEVSMRKKNEDLLVQQSKLAAMGEMLGAIAHQWRQPLNALGLIVQNLKDAHDLGELDKDYLERTVQRSMIQIQHMSTTIDDFRNFFRPDKEKTTFDVMRSVGDVLSLFSAQLAANDISYRLACRTHGKVFENETDIVPCPAKTIIGYRNEFEHVILNLINNAREAILERREQGRPGKGELSIDFITEHGRVIIRVHDNGIGIQPSALNRIFEPYFTTKDSTKGTGLGLYMSKVIIEDHMGGTLAAANGDQGAVFTIELMHADERRTS